MCDYIVSKKECQERILGVCRGCGGKLTPIETVDNAGRPTYWSGCERCGVFDGGCDPKMHKIARRLVEDGIITPYTFDSRYEAEKKGDERWERWLSSQTRGAVAIVYAVISLFKEDINA